VEIVATQQTRILKFWKELLPLLKETWSEFQKDNAEQLGAALAFYSMFSLFPLLILSLAGLGFVLQYHESAVNIQREILHAAARTFSPQFSRTLRGMLEIIQDKAATATWAGLITLFFGASRVFQQLDTSFKRIWRVPKKRNTPGIMRELLTYLLEKLYAIVITLLLGPLLIFSVVLTALSDYLVGMLSSLPMVSVVAGYVIGFCVTLMLNTLIFALLFKYLPGTDVRWSDVIFGAALTALLWEVAKRFLAIYIEQNNYNDAYGIVGGMLVLMAWVYFSSQMLFLGAEFTEIYSRRCGSRASGSKGE
jgi:membrane protein